MAVVEFVRALMSDSRYRELKRIKKLIEKRASDPRDGRVIYTIGGKEMSYINERMQATKTMAKAIEKFALEKEGKREWKRKSKDKHKRKHGSHRSSRSSRD